MTTTTTRPRAAVRMHVTPNRAAAAVAPTSFDTPYPVPERPPAAWFARPDFLSPGMRFTIGDDGRCYGYVATREAVRLADGRTFTAPRSPSGYSRAHQGQVETAEGDVVRVGIIGARNHGDTAHYWNPDQARALVTFGDDEHGTWCAGALVPGVSYADVAELRRCSLSGHWEPFGGALDLVGAALVNVPAFALGVEAHEVGTEGATRVATPARDQAAHDAETARQYRRTVEVLTELDALLAPAADALHAHQASAPSCGCVSPELVAAVARARRRIVTAQAEALGAFAPTLQRAGGLPVTPAARLAAVEASILPLPPPIAA